MLDVAKSCKINKYENLAAFAVQVQPHCGGHSCCIVRPVYGCSVKAYFQIYYRGFFALDALFL